MTSGRASLRVLQGIVRDSTERTLEATNKAKDRRKQRAERKAAAEKPDVPTFSLEIGQPVPELINSTKVEDWFREALYRLYGEKLELPQRGHWWHVRERTNAMRLLKEYGPERVRKAVDFLCATWEERMEKSGGLLGGIPNINYLMKARDIVFPESQGLAKIQDQSLRKKQRKRKSKDTDEYRPPEVAIDVGWYV